MTEFAIRICLLRAAAVDLDSIPAGAMLILYTTLTNMSVVTTLVHI